MRDRLHHLRGAFDRQLDAVVRHAATEIAVHLVADLRVGRIRIAIEQRLRRHHLAALAESARGNLLVDPRLLDRMEPAVLREPFESRDRAAHGRHRRHARSNGDAVDDDRARAALAETTAEMRTVESEIVAQHV